MIRKCLNAIAVITTISLLAEPADAQISFGVTQQNGVVTGGSFTVNGIVTNGGTGVRMGINAGTAQLIGIQQFTFQNFSPSRPSASANKSRKNKKPTAEQFVQAAGRFDADKNKRLDEKELEQIAAAVLKEINLKKIGNNKSNGVQYGANDKSKSAVPRKSMEEMIKGFVKHCLTFDKDDDDALNPAETKRMATALIRSLS